MNTQRSTPYKTLMQLKAHEKKNLYDKNAELTREKGREREKEE